MWEFLDNGSDFDPPGGRHRLDPFHDHFVKAPSLGKRRDTQLSVENRGTFPVLPEGAHPVPAPDQELHHLSMRRLIESIHQEPSPCRCLRLGKASGAGQGRGPPADELPPISPEQLSLISVPLFEMRRVSQIEAVKEAPPIEGHCLPERTNTLWTNLVDTMLVSHSTQCRGLANIYPGTTGVEADPIPLGG
jgi:hypothetical protein